MFPYFESVFVDSKKQTVVSAEIFTFEPETFFLSCLGSIDSQSQGWCTGATVVAVRGGGPRLERKEQLGIGIVRRVPPNQTY